MASLRRTENHAVCIVSKMLSYKAPKGRYLTTLEDRAGQKVAMWHPLEGRAGQKVAMWHSEDDPWEPLTPAEKEVVAEEEVDTRCPVCLQQFGADGTIA